MKLLIFLAFFSAILALVFFQVEGLTCYSCGYREDADGTRTEIPNTYEDVPFCGVDNLNDTSNVHTEEAPVGGCCAAFKVQETIDGTVHYISRFGSAGDPDEKIFNFTCGEPDDKYTCAPENVKYADVEDIGNVCHCYSDKCNTEVPALSTSSNLSPSTTTIIIINIITLFGILSFVDL